MSEVAAASRPRIIVYGHNRSEFPTPASLTDFIAKGVIENRCRYRYTQSKNADIIVLSRHGFAFGHFEITNKEKPNALDREQYSPVKWVYIVGARAIYPKPVRLFTIFGKQVNSFGLAISEAEFDQIQMRAGHIQTFDVTSPSNVVDGKNEESPNIFRRYDNLENHFTNGLISILSLSHFVCPQFLASFLMKLGIDPVREVRKFRVLRLDGTADAELSGDDFCVLFETKIERGRLDDKQICRHLKKPDERSEAQRCLILLTPDDGSSSYIQDRRSSCVRQLPSLDKNCVRHLGWKEVYEFFESSLKKEDNDVFSQLRYQFLDYIHDRIIEQDIVE